MRYRDCFCIDTILGRRKYHRIVPESAVTNFKKAWSEWDGARLLGPLPEVSLPVEPPHDCGACRHRLTCLVNHQVGRLFEEIAIEPTVP